MMSKTINVFKTENMNNSLYSAAPEITDIRSHNGTITAKITAGLDQGDTILGFDHACKVVDVQFVCVSGTKAAQAFTVYRGTASVATAALAILRPVAPNTKYSPVSFYYNKANISDGGALCIGISGTTWATSMTGLLIIKTIPN
jgi:hypothetical protein